MLGWDWRRTCGDESLDLGHTSSLEADLPRDAAVRSHRCCAHRL